VKVSLELIDESPTQPRDEASYDESSTATLARSIRAQGLIHWPIVRPKGERYELVVGERRRRAYLYLGLEEMECHVRELDDGQVAEIQIVENLQRKDLTPMEEARGYEYLATDMGYTERKIADKVGRALRYIHGRRSLVQLCPEAVEALEGDRITLLHATCLCRLQVEDQTYLLRRIFEGCLDGEALKEVIRQELVRNLDQAPFDCKGCLKTTTAQADLFGSTQKRGCLDPSCWDTKMTEHVASSGIGLRLSMVQKKTIDGVIGKKEWEEADETAPSQEGGIIVDGARRGETVEVCLDREWIREQRRPEPKPPSAPDPLIEFAAALIEKSREDHFDEVEALWDVWLMPRLNKNHVKRAAGMVGVDLGDLESWEGKDWMDFRLVMMVLGEGKTEALEGFLKTC